MIALGDRRGRHGPAGECGERESHDAYDAQGVQGKSAGELGTGTGRSWPHSTLSPVDPYGCHCDPALIFSALVGPSLAKITPPRHKKKSTAWKAQRSQHPYRLSQKNLTLTPTLAETGPPTRQRNGTTFNSQAITQYPPPWPSRGGTGRTAAPAATPSQVQRREERRLVKEC